MKFQEGVFDGSGCGLRRQTDSNLSQLSVCALKFSFSRFWLKKEAKKPLYRPIGFQEVEDPKISRRQMLQSQPYAPAAFTPTPPRKHSWDAPFC